MLQRVMAMYLVMTKNIAIAVELFFVWSTSSVQAHPCFWPYVTFHSPFIMSVSRTEIIPFWVIYGFRWHEKLEVDNVYFYRLHARTQEVKNSRKEKIIRID